MKTLKVIAMQHAQHNGASFTVFTGVRVCIPFNTGTRQHKQAKGKGSYVRKNKFQKPVDTGE